MSDLRKLARMQWGYYACFFFITVLVMGILYEAFADPMADPAAGKNFAETMSAYGFMCMHMLLFVEMGILLIGRQLFVAGVENREFVRMLPVRAASRRLFVVLAGLVFVTSIYLTALIQYLLFAKRGGILNGAPVHSFLKGFFFSIAEYHLWILAGLTAECIFRAVRSFYYRSVEGGTDI